MQALMRNAWFKAFIAGVGILSDAFNFFSINLVKNVMSNIYPQTSAQTSAIGTAALVGAVFGQVVFGSLADKLGRRTIFISTIAMVIIGSLGASSSTQNDKFDVYAQLTMWLALLGFGVGGEYPLSATVTSEGSSTAQRGKAVSSVFAMQGVGNVLASLVMFILLKSSLSLDAVWRVALGLGAAPGLLTVYFRYKMEESSHFSKLTDKDDERKGLLEGESEEANMMPSAAVLQPTMVEVSRTWRDNAFVNAVHNFLHTLYVFRWVLIGTAGSWFIFDVVFYANGLFSGTVLDEIGFSSSAPAGQQSKEDLATLALGNLILACIGLPGYFVAIWSIDRLGRKRMQGMGFLMIGILFYIMAGALKPLTDHVKGLFVFIYGLTFFFSNFGPNMSTFVIPAEAFPTYAKATCHGLSAASGKIGASVGAAIMDPLLKMYGDSTEEKQHGLQVVLYVCASVSMFGLLWTLLFTKESGSINIEDLDAQFVPRGTPSKQVTVNNSDRDWQLEHDSVIPVPQSPSRERNAL